MFVRLYDLWVNLSMNPDLLLRHRHWSWPRTRSRALMSASKLWRTLISQWIRVQSLSISYLLENAPIPHSQRQAKHWTLRINSPVTKHRVLVRYSAVVHFPGGNRHEDRDIPVPCGLTVCDGIVRIRSLSIAVCQYFRSVAWQKGRFLALYRHEFPCSWNLDRTVCGAVCGHATNSALLKVRRVDQPSISSILSTGLNPHHVLARTVWDSHLPMGIVDRILAYLRQLRMLLTKLRDGTGCSPWLSYAAASRRKPLRRSHFLSGSRVSWRRTPEFCVPPLQDLSACWKW